MMPNIDEGSDLYRLAREAHVNWISTRESAGKEWEALVARAKQRVASKDKGTVPWSDEWAKGLQRKYRVTKTETNESPFGSGLVSQLVGLTLSLMEKSRRGRVKEVFRRLHIHEMSLGAARDTLKELTGVALHHGNTLFPYGLWMSVMYFETQFGSPPLNPEAIRKFKDQVKAWTFTPKLEDEEGSLRERVIIEGLNFLQKMVPRMEDDSTWDDFIASPTSWLANGASDGPAVLGARKTKFATFSVSSREQLWKEATDRSGPSYRVSIKRERGKLRNLINSPWSMHVQMAFVGSGSRLAKHFFKYIPTTLAGNTVELWESLRKRVARKELLVPIDQSTFDHVPSGRVIRKILKLIVNKAALRRCAKRRQVADILLKRMEKGTVEFEGQLLPHKRGVLSGWLWTSLIGTITNYAEYVGVTRLMGVPTPFNRGENFQGDDAIVPCRTFTQAIKIVEGYMAVLPVNPNKFFVDRSRVEYLRYVVSAKGRLGYLARAVPSVVVASAYSGGAVTAASIAAQWSVLHSRGGTRQATLSGCLRDLCGHLRCDVATARNLLGTPASVGGLGYNDLGNSRWVTVKGDEVVKIGDRQTRSGNWESILPTQQTRIRRALSSHPGLKFKSLGAAQGLAGGIFMKKGGPEQRREVVVRDRPLIGTIRLGGWRVRPPSFDGDPLYREGILREAWRTGGLLGVLESLPRGERGRVASVFSTWSRALWLSWIFGHLSLTIGKVWGDSSTFLEYLGRRYSGVALMTKRMSVADFRARTLAIELLTSTVEPHLRRRVGA
jgi:hypothetical protein